MIKKLSFIFVPVVAGVIYIGQNQISASRFQNETEVSLGNTENIILNKNLEPHPNKAIDVSLVQNELWEAQLEEEQVSDMVLRDYYLESGKDQATISVYDTYDRYALQNLADVGDIYALNKLGEIYRYSDGEYLRSESVFIKAFGKGNVNSLSNLQKMYSRSGKTIKGILTEQMEMEGLSYDDSVELYRVKQIAYSLLNEKYGNAGSYEYLQRLVKYNYGAINKSHYDKAQVMVDSMLDQIAKERASLNMGDMPRHPAPPYMGNNISSIFI